MACACAECNARKNAPRTQTTLPIAEMSNPGPIGRVAGSFTNRQGQQIVVIAKRGEAASAAVARVRARHGM